MRATHCSPRRAHENDDVEQSHHRFKRAVHQELILRGSRNFASREEYAEFLRRLLKRRNTNRRERLQEELALLRALPARRLEDCTFEQVKVTRNSTVLVRSNIYSVPSQLIDERVEVRVYAEHLEVWYAGSQVSWMERLRGDGRHAINYRHVIHSLVRKPGAFASYRYRQSLFPRLLFRVAYDMLSEQYPSTADRQYLKLLQLAASTSEEHVAIVLHQLIERGEIITFQKVQEAVQSIKDEQATPAHSVEVRNVELDLYDGLLQVTPTEEVVEQWTL